MIGARSWTRGWWLAAGLSAGLHGAAAGALLWQPRLPVSDAAPLGELRLEIAPVAETVAPDPAGIVTPAASRTLVAAPPDGASDQVLTPITPEEQPDLVLSAALPVVSIPQPGPSRAATVPAAPDAPPPDPRVTRMFDRIRDRLTEPCLLALPALLGGDQLQLSVMAASDRQITDLMRDLTQGFPAQIVERAALLDRRQCPALAFARRDPGYPLPGLALQLEGQDVTSGGDLAGRVSGGAGLYTTLLLVDDNGVVHDLRRFLVGSAAGARFRVPVARSGQPRDTFQILLAVATPSRPDAVNTHAGKDAADFFAALGQEVGNGLRVGVATVYLR